MARDPKGIEKLATSASLDLFRYVRQNCNLEMYVGHNCILKCTVLLVAVLFSVFLKINLKYCVTIIGKFFKRQVDI